MWYLLVRTPFDVTHVSFFPLAHRLCLCSFALKARHHPDGLAERSLHYNTHFSLLSYKHIRPS